MFRGALFPVKLKNWAPPNKIQYSIRKALNELAFMRIYEDEAWLQSD